MNEGQAYAARWIAAWNSMNLERALSLWADDLEFASPLAEQITGSAVLRGKASAAAYWRRALAASTRFHFTLRDAHWDPDTRTVTIVYRRERGDEVRLAAEIVRLNADGVGVRGIALHGPRTD